MPDHVEVGDETPASGQAADELPGGADAGAGMGVMLHTGKVGPGMVLWAERLLTVEVSPTGTSRGRRPREPLARAHPFSATHEEIEAALEACDLEVALAPSQKVTATVWLPGQGGVPLPSSPLVAEWRPAAARPVTLSGWNVSAVMLDPPSVTEILLAFGDRRVVVPGVILGQEFAFWSRVLLLAGSLVTRQRYLPSVKEQGGTYRSVWEPMPDAVDLEHLARLGGALPAVSRAVTLTEGGEPPVLVSRELVEAMVGEAVDYLVRSSILPPWPATATSKGQIARPAFDSLHDQWLHSLCAVDGTLSGDANGLARLAGAVRSWREPLLATTAAPYRLCFRLEEPGGPGEDNLLPHPDPEEKATSVGIRSGMDRSGSEEDRWFVRFLVQAADDPSLLVPADQTWNQRGSMARSLACRGADPLQFLLGALGQASGICPRIEQSLRTSQPSGYVLDTTGAHEFLTVKSMLLEQAGFTVLLPAWWTRKGTKKHLTARARVTSPQMVGRAGFTLDQVVQFEWEIALGGEPLSLEEIQALARIKAPLVRLRGQWVQMRAEEIAAAVAFWRANAPRGVTAREVVRMAIGASSPSGEIPFEGVTASGWLQELLARLEQKSGLEELEAPDGFAGTLRPYQVRGYSWLVFLRDLELGACLADDMGLGKTIQTLALLQRDRLAGERRPVLLICPTSVVNNWQKEAARFTPDLEVLVHHGVARSKGEEFVQQAGRYALVLSSYALLQRDLALLQEVQWAGLVLDEAQNIKNPETRQARAARSLAAGYRLALTGTPVENTVGDLWSVMEFLNPGLLGSQTSFKREFFIPIQVGRDPVAIDRLKRITTPFVLRRLKTDRSIIADLPEKQEMKVFCNLTREQASLYAAVLEQTQAEIEQAEGIQRRGLILSMLTKLKQTCNHPAQLLGDGSAIPGRSGKLNRLVEMLEEALAVGDRALVFTQFAEMGDILKRHLQESFGHEVLFLHGSVAKKQRDTLVERFQAPDGPPVFVLSLKAGGTGLNLTRANHVFHFDRWWNPAVENQATDRAFRIGQTRDVQVHKFVCAGTFEERIDGLIERKKEIARDVVGTGEGWLTELSNEQIRSIFTLRAEAIGE